MGIIKRIRAKMDDRRELLRLVDEGAAAFRLSPAQRKRSRKLALSNERQLRRAQRRQKRIRRVK